MAETRIDWIARISDLKRGQGYAPETRLRWLEKLLELKPGGIYSPRGRWFEGVYSTPQPAGVRGSTTIEGKRIDLDCAKIPDPISQFVCGSHELAHVLFGDKSYSDPVEQSRANGFAVQEMNRLLDDPDLSTRVVHYVCIEGRPIEDLPELHTILKRLIESRDPRGLTLVNLAFDYLENKPILKE